MLKKSLNLRLKYAKSMLVNVTLITYQMYENTFFIVYLVTERRSNEINFEYI